MRKHGTVSWSELNTRNLEQAKSFYSAVFGWEFETIPTGDHVYIMALLGGEYVAGFFDMNTLEMLNGVPDHWFTYFAVDDLDASVNAVVDAGGTIKRAPFDIPGGLRLAIVVDAGGAVMGFNQSASVGDSAA